MLFWIAYAIFPQVAPYIAEPFVVLAAYIAFLQFRSGAPGNVAERLAEFRSMSWESFSAAVTAAHRRKAYVVTPGDHRGYDFKLVKGGEVLLLQCRRWKVNQVGAEPIRELALAVGRQEARRGISVAAGEL